MTQQWIPVAGAKLPPPVSRVSGLSKPVVVLQKKYDRYAQFIGMYDHIRKAWVVQFQFTHLVLESISHFMELPEDPV